MDTNRIDDRIGSGRCAIEQHFVPTLAQRLIRSSHLQVVDVLRLFSAQFEIQLTLKPYTRLMHRFFALGFGRFLIAKSFFLLIIFAHHHHHRLRLRLLFLLVHLFRRHHYYDCNFFCAFHCVLTNLTSA